MIKVTILENNINELLDNFAPYKTFTIRKPNSTPWLNEEISDIMNKRDMFKTNFNKTRNQTFFSPNIKNSETKLLL